MIQRIIGFILGGLTIWILLNVTNAMSGDVQPKWALSILIGLIVAWLWPWVIGIILVRRAKSRRKDEIDREVQEQLAAQNKNT
jgi:hypothetical protein